MKVLKIYLLLPAMFLVVSCVYGQKSEGANEFTAKIYSNSFMEIDKRKTSVELFRTFSPSISWGKSFGDFQEVELTDFKLCFKEKANWGTLGANYSYNFRVAKNATIKKVNFFMGVGAGVLFSGNSVSNESVSGFGSTGMHYHFNIVPRMTMRLGKRAFLDISTPYSYYKNAVGDFSVSELPNKNGSQTAVFPNQFTVKVGVAFKF